MTSEQFESLVVRLESQATTSPQVYRFKVGLLAALGYGYLAIILLVILLLFVGLIISIATIPLLAGKLAILFGGLLWLMLRSCWITSPPQLGLPVSPHDSPELFKRIDNLRSKLNAPRLHRVLLTDAFNASIAQIPVLGPFGWTRNYLTLGLPLMQALSIDQFEAVLAHEFGHLTRGDNYFSNWIYGQRRRWARLVAAMEQKQSHGILLFYWFLNWFLPRFDAYSFPLARANEYAADSSSVRVVSARITAQALTTAQIVDYFLTERFWPEVFKTANQSPEPKIAPFRLFPERLESELDQITAAEWLQRAMARKTTLVGDTHPALADRLRAIGEPPSFMPGSPQNSASNLLGTAKETLTAELDQQWRQLIAPQWKTWHESVNKACAGQGN